MQSNSRPKLPFRSIRKQEDYDHNDDIRSFYKLYREYEEHENHLLNHRVTWLILLQAALIATFGYSIQKHYEILAKVAESETVLKAACVNTAEPLARPVCSMKSSFPEIAAAMNGFPESFGQVILVICVVGLLSGLAGFFGVGSAVLAQNALRNKWKCRFHRRAEALGLPHIAGAGNQWAEAAGGLLAVVLPFGFCALWGTLMFSMRNVLKTL